MPTLTLDIVSDVVCPWCYIGKRRLEGAMAILAPDLVVERNWLPFELNPGLPAEGVDRKAHYTRKFGSWERFQELEANVMAAAAGEGLEFHQDRLTRQPSTFAAHRLIWLAGREGVQDAVVEALFKAHFTECRNIGDPATLIAIATAAGMDEAGITAFLASDEAVAEIRAEEAKAHSRGVSGVPTFMAAGTPLFSGAHPAGAIAGALRQVAEQLAAG